MTSPKDPPCGMADCNEPATRVDAGGVGYCEGCGSALARVSRKNPFDRWWAIATTNQEAFKDLNYGEFPPGWTGPE